MLWGDPNLFLKIVLLRYFHASQIIKLGTKAQALLIISFVEKFFLQFLKVLVILPMSLSICLKIDAIQFHKMEVNGQRLRRCSIVSSCDSHSWHWLRLFS